MFTSLKALKWSYNLGVKQERQRIARLLEGHSAALGNEYGVEHNMLREMPDSAKQRKARLELKHAATMRVQEIINAILRPQYQDQPMTSLMFPEDESEPK